MYTDETWYITKDCVITHPGMKDIRAMKGDRVSFKLLPNSDAASFNGTVDRAKLMSKYGYLLVKPDDYEVDV